MKKHTCIGLSTLVLLTAFLFVAGGTVGAAEFFLRTGTRQLTMPDNAVVTVWGFALDADNNFATVDGSITSPGPMLTVTPDDAVLIIHLHNDLPEPVSLVIPGQAADMTPQFFTDGQGRRRVRAFTYEAAANGGEAIYTWNNIRPGTYLYQSGSHAAVQVQMGLFGGLRKNYAAQEAYPGVTYDREAVLLLSEIDPALHQAVTTGNFGSGTTMTSTINYAPKYFLFSGQAEIILTGIVPDLAIGQRLLVRFLNAGLISRQPVLLGPTMTVWTEDGNPLPYADKERDSLTCPAGKTTDLTIVPTSPGRVALFDRRGYVSRGAADGTGTPTQQVIVGMEIPPAGGTDVPAPASGGSGGGGGGGCFISIVRLFK